MPGPGALDVHGATPVAPTETERKAGLDHFIGPLRVVAERGRAGDENLKSAPHFGPQRRLDETAAARSRVLAQKEAAADVSHRNIRDLTPESRLTCVLANGQKARSEDLVKGG